MGSATLPNAKPTAMENTDKRSIKTLIKSLFNKKKEKTKDNKKVTTETEKSQAHKRTEEQNTQTNEQNRRTQQKTQNVNPVATLLENFRKLELENKNKDESKVIQAGSQNELDNFTFKVIEDHRHEWKDIEEHRNERIGSQSSEDSGYSDNKERTDTEEVNEDRMERTVSEETESEVHRIEKITDGLEELELNGNKKKLQPVFVKRGPMRNGVCLPVAKNPYPTHDDSFRQIHQINKHTLTGGQVIVNSSSKQDVQDSLSEVDIACTLVGSRARYLRDQEGYLQDVLEYIKEDSTKVPTSIPSPEYSMQDVMQPSISEYKEIERNAEREIIQIIQEIQDGRDSAALTNPVEQLINNNLINKDDLNCIFNYVEQELNSNDSYQANYMFPTPPRSENVPSPPLGSPNSFYPSNSEYTLSPERSPVYTSDYEKYQEIPHFEEEKHSVENNEKKPRERTNSISSMTMKQFKDLQKDIANEFSKKECCKGERPSCRALFEGFLEKLDKNERKSLCAQVAKFDLNLCYGVLKNILLGLSRGSVNEDRQQVLFALLCENILTTDAKLFLGDVGLTLLKASSLRCPHRPLLTRYIIQCIRTALQADPTVYKGKECVFHEVDALGDNLVLACARGGDRFADVLSELVRTYGHQPPLFRLHHNNEDGHTALHVSCALHSAARPHVHTAHVLLEHAGADLWKGDMKGGDTALHLAANSANCDLRLIMLLFKHVDRKLWKSLAHCQNMSSMTPIEYARSAIKSTTRQNYPPEVLDFLKKCR